MLIVRFTTEGAVPRVGVLTHDERLHDLEVDRAAELLTRSCADLRGLVDEALSKPPVAAGDAVLHAPVDGRTEVWAAGVTYRRSQVARMEESAVQDVYARVYDAARPELFFKSVAWRVVGDGGSIGIRRDSPVNVPEPELALVVNRFGETIGFAACNDVSSRTLEGENPLYLPQAKIYDASCAIGPGIRPVWEAPSVSDLAVEIVVSRRGATAWRGATRTSLMKRTPHELVEYLFRANSFPFGVVLATGTGLVPGLDFTLEPGDTVRIDIEQVGSLTNHVISVGVDGSTHSTGDP